MSVTEKCEQLHKILVGVEEDFLSQSPERRTELGVLASDAKGLPRKTPFELPVWGSLETVPSSPMLQEWFGFANGWNEFLLGRRALSLEEMRNPRVGLQHYLLPTQSNEEREQHINFQIQHAIPTELETLAVDPDYVSLENPKVVLFGLPLLSSVSGVDFLVYADNTPSEEPKVFLNEYLAQNVEDMLDWLIGEG